MPLSSRRPGIWIILSKSAPKFHGWMQKMFKRGPVFHVDLGASPWPLLCDIYLPSALFERVPGRRSLAFLPTTVHDVHCNSKRIASTAVDLCTRRSIHLPTVIWLQEVWRTDDCYSDCFTFLHRASPENNQRVTSFF